MSESAGQLARDEWRDVALGDSEMALRVLAFDWAATPLGPLPEWPSSLRAVVGLVLRSPAQMTVYWGPELTCIYNDAERDIIGDLHPRALGQPARELLRESWDVLEPQLAAVLAGHAILLRDEPLRFDRHGAVQLGWFTYSYSPIPDDGGGVGGVLLVSDETTAEVLGRRRMDCLQALGTRSLDAVGAKAAAAAAAAALDGRADTPFALVYLADGADATHAAGAVGAAPRISIEPSTEAGAVLRELADERPSGVVVPAALFADTPVRDAFVAPLSGGSRDALAGFLIAGLSDEVPFDDAYRDFMANVARVVGRSLASARARADERERSRSLEALGRARTALFSNAAHELRTPLTLILGAIDQLDDADAQVARRSALRMLELVNALLDVSRIEAGEPLGAFQPTDLAALTREVAGMFGQAARGAGLSLLIGCPPLHGPVYVDRESWERIVSNLLSNAIKYTPTGSVRVGLAADDGAAVLTVEDTGIGIPPRDRERVFSRFYRVVDNRARTSGGTGIGLALVRRLVELHAGTVRAEGAGDGGTRLVVRIPFGHAHLDGRVAEQRAEAPPIGGAAVAYVAEAEGWLDERTAITTPRRPERALVIDDNADMRAYLRRLLAPHYAVEAAADGLAGLAAAVAEPPTVIISDVMLPGLDGMALLRSLRQNAATRDVPVILVSARTGREGLQALELGADDYIVKPFGGRELVARVRATVENSRLRGRSGEARGRAQESANQHRQLRALLDELKATQRRAAVAADAERRRIERDIHDGAQQRLTAVRLKLGGLVERLGDDPVGAELEGLHGDLDGALQELRELAHGLYPPLLASDGLGTALAAACRRAAMPVEFEPGDVGRLPPAIESAAYFCCVEALQNVAKHAGAEARARVRLGIRHGVLELEVRDDGAGFTDGDAPDGQGLANLRDRRVALGGDVAIASARGRGTVVSAQIPLP